MKTCILFFCNDSFCLEYTPICILTLFSLRYSIRWYHNFSCAFSLFGTQFWCYIVHCTYAKHRFECQYECQTYAEHFYSLHVHAFWELLFQLSRFLPRFLLLSFSRECHPYKWKFFFWKLYTVQQQCNRNVSQLVGFVSSFSPSLSVRSHY